MGNEDGSEDRLTKNEFAELIQHLSVQEILMIEYRTGTNWNKLFLRKNGQIHNFFCNLCVLETSSFKNLLAHIDGRKHKLRMERVEQLYQQDYTYPKNYQKDNAEKLEYGEDVKTYSTVEKQPRNVQNKSNGSLKFSTEFESHSKTGKCGKDYKINSNQLNVTPQKILNNLSKNVEDVNTKDDIKTLNVNPALKGTKISVPKIPEKRCFIESCNDKSIDSKKPKILVNPAALSSRANAAKANELSGNARKPEYQTDRIIIPTAQKSKAVDKSPASSLQVEANVSPKFSMKSYSSIPSVNDVHGILGVEYVIKILKNHNDISPRYECGLCELVLDGFAMQRHLEGYNHRLKFCEKHFPTAVRQYRHYMQNVPEPEIFKVMAPVLAKLAQAIEQHHGRNLPYECYEREFSLNRHEILAKAFSCRHASEQYGPTFTHVVGTKEIDEFINSRHNYLPPPFSRTALFDARPNSIFMKSNSRHRNYTNSELLGENLRYTGRENLFSDGSVCRSYSSSGFQNDIWRQEDDGSNPQPVDDETYNLMVDDFLKGTLKRVSGKNSIHNTSKRLSPIQSSDTRRSLSPIRQDDIWQTYRHLVDQELCNLDERFKIYRKEPESHPCYNEEWQKFWKRRKDELVSAGVDYRNYNYQPEWVRFVKIRIEELYGQEMENVKIKSRELLCLPMTNEKITDTKYHVESQQDNVSNAITTTNYNKQQNTSCSNTSQTQYGNAPQVIPVLRLMTALEDNLGSLGPKIIDLLSKALQTEKINPLHVNYIILNENRSLIETATEKLKGLIITGLFEGSKKKVLKQVVTDAEALLHYPYQLRKKKLSSRRISPDSSINQIQNNSSLSFDNISFNIPGALNNQSGSSILVNKTAPSSSFDKKELASKLATSLVAQGKTEFDSSQLQQIIAVYKLIEKKKRETAGTVLPNKHFLQDLTSSKKALSDTLSDLLKPGSSALNVTTDNRDLSNDATNTSVVPDIFANNAPSNSCTSVLQNPRGDFFNSTARSISNTYGGNSFGGGNLMEQQSDYAKNYFNVVQPNSQNFNSSQINSSLLQNNSRIDQNWTWNSNMNGYQNYNIVNLSSLEQNPNSQNI